MRLALLGVVVLGVVGCSTVPQEDADGPYYTQGFSDGCRTAEARRAAFDNRSYRNEELYASQASYRTGWRQGFRECQPDGVNPVTPTVEGTSTPL